MAFNLFLLFIFLYNYQGSIFQLRNSTVFFSSYATTITEYNTEYKTAGIFRSSCTNYKLPQIA